MKYEEWLAHFNPNHDPKNGQFAKKQSGRFGQKKYQNDDGSLNEKGKQKYGKGIDYDKGVTLKKGTVLSRYSFTGNETNTGRTYTFFKPGDDKKYKEGFEALAGLTGQDYYKYDLIAKEDIKMPSRKQMVDMYIDLLQKSDPNNRILKKGRAYQEKSFDKFHYNLVKPSDATNEYFSYCTARGYNALIDNSDMMRGAMAELPVIVIDRGKSLIPKAITLIQDKN